MPYEEVASLDLSRSRSSIFRHFRSLGEKGKRMRFFYLPSETSLYEYVLRLDGEEDFLYGIYDQQKIIALSQLSRIPKTDDFAFSVSVLEGHRREGLGKKIVGSVIEEAKKLNANSIMTECLKTNSAIKNLLRANGIQFSPENLEILKGKLILDKSTIDTFDYNSGFPELFDIWMENQMVGLRIFKQLYSQ